MFWKHMVGVSQVKADLSAFGRYRGVSQLYCRKSRFNGPLKNHCNAVDSSCNSFWRKLAKAAAVRNSVPERFSGKFRRCWKTIARFSGSAKCYPCQGLGTFRQGKRLVENWPRLRDRCWIFSSETATAFLSSDETGGIISLELRPRRPARK